MPRAFEPSSAGDQGWWWNSGGERDSFLQLGVSLLLRRTASENSEGLTGGYIVLGDVAEFLIALFEQPVDRYLIDLSQVELQTFINHAHGAGWIGVSAAVGLGEHIVDAAQVLDVVGRVLECGRRLLFFTGVLPHDRRASLRRNDGVDGVLQHQNAVRDSESQRPTGSAFACDRRNGWDSEPRHFQEIAGDRLPLASLFGADAGIGSRQVEERKNRMRELLRNLHAAKSFAVTLRVRGAELPFHALLQGAAFEVSDDHYGTSVKARHSTGHGGIIAKGAVAMYFAEICKQGLNKVHRVRAFGVSRKLRFGPCFGNRRCGRVCLRGPACFVFCHPRHCIGQGSRELRARGNLPSSRKVLSKIPRETFGLRVERCMWTKVKIHAAATAVCRIAVVAALAGAGLKTGFADAQRNGDATTLQVFSRLTVLDVTATDDTGAPVQGLKQSDFTILEDGRPQPIRNFDEVRSERRQNPPPLPSDVYTNVQLPPASPAVNILLLDLANLAPEDPANEAQVSNAIRNQNLVKQAALRAMDGLPTGTSIAVLAMTNSLRVLQGFTSDQRILKAAIGAVPYDLSGLGGKQSVQRDERNRMVLEVFDQIAASTASMKVRKNLIWLAMGNPDLTDPNHDPVLPNYSGSLFKTYARLMAARVSIYPIDARGVIAGAQQDVNAQSIAQLSMSAIAEATGGISYFNGDISAEMLKAIDNGASYYSIAYVPPTNRFDGTYHAIDVRVNRPGIHLVFRKGYYAEDITKFAERPAVTLTLEPPQVTKGNMKAPMTRGMPLSRGLLFDVAVAPDTAAPAPGQPAVLGIPNAKLKKKQMVRYAFRYVIPSEQLTFVTGPNNTHRGQVELDIAVYDDMDTLVTSLSQTLTMPLSDTSFQKMMWEKTPIRFQQQIDLPEGQLFVRVGLLEPATDKAGTLEFPLHIGKGGVALSGAGAAGQTAR